MDKLIVDSIAGKDDTAGLLVAVCVLLSFQVLAGVVKFLWGLKEKKDQLSEQSVQKLALSMEQNTEAVGHLEGRLKSLESSLAEIPKIKIDLRRYYLALKMIAGEDWPAVREEITKDSEL